jgi:dCMP deaminase
VRPSIDEYLMRLAEVAATRTTCIRRGVGCVLADARGRVLAVGYNGVASGLSHCNQRTSYEVDNTGPPDFDDVYNPVYAHACEGHHLPPGQDSCEAVHAEQNALLQCQDPDRVDSAYVTLSPCKACLKLLVNTGCRRIVFREEHVDPLPRELWLKSRHGREWFKLLRPEEYGLGS